MDTMNGPAWTRNGSSIIWSPQLLGPLISSGPATPLRTVLGWMTDGFPESPPGDHRHVLVGGLQTVLETLMQESNEAAYGWLRRHILPLVRAFYGQWPNAALVFVMEGPSKLFQHHESDDLVYFGRAKTRDGKIKLTLGMWNGAATGEGAFRVVPSGGGEVGGYYVQRVS